ncbi:dihydropyrimidine dehydrogenase (NADP(+)), chloroplastic [Selaginella moellendorffii]|uniref:dihydropyrimidine dehydrogenase (NADP(+)), chloroplastic n=1 Tax=Selaginella moellendorffii TaxID=88036 RepID=UPI000D1CC800|nr:dihydropyrimidine dehydrogenase (NADP(+)), chloroplastic [Selaginella moellendorffii]|eukprot:XP_002967964.2 dihydropyrimidine dehydrogenase (NADP(+)), chloroplastic [Selaginella moellendorffii]
MAAAVSMRGLVPALACDRRGGGFDRGIPTRIACSSENLADGAPDLSVSVNGLRLPNPFVIGSGPPGTNYTVMKKAFDEGWGAVISKTLSLDSTKVINVTPRYARMRSGNGPKDVIGWENIELISDRPFETMLAELRRLKQEYPDRILIGSIMEEYDKDAWEEIIERVEATGVDALEINFSCPHGMPERKMGAAVGKDCDLLGEVCSWINAKATVPVWAKMTPNVTDITQPARTAIEAGCEGLSAINTITSIMGINLDTLRPEPCVEGYSTPGGYSSRAVRPIALAKVMAIAQMLKSEYPDRNISLSGIGGVESGDNAAEFILLGANTVQVCTGVMMYGYPLVKRLCKELQAFMAKHNFTSLDDFRGTSLQYMTTHTDLVQRQQEAIRSRRAARKGLASDKDWTGDGFVKETELMVSN